MIAFVSSSNSVSLYTFFCNLLVTDASQDCQEMASDYEKAALGLYPSVPTYAVNCDDEGNKDLCQEQNVKTLPTIKVRLICFESPLRETDENLVISTR
jgi:hypothetical protein